LSQRHTQDTVGDMVPEFANGFQSDKELLYSLLLLGSVVRPRGVLLDAGYAFTEMAILELRKFLGWQVCFQIILNMQIQRAKVDDKKSDGRNPAGTIWHHWSHALSQSLFAYEMTFAISAATHLIPSDVSTAKGKPEHHSLPEIN